MALRKTDVDKNKYRNKVGHMEMPHPIHPSLIKDKVQNKNISQEHSWEMLYL